MAEESDWSALMVRAQGGDAAAYRQLLGAVTPYLRALAHRAGLDGPEIEDGVQDILLTLHMIRHTYDPTRPFAPWLVGVAQHRLTDRLRRRGRQGAREMPLTEEHETFAHDETNHHEERSDSRRLRGAIETLPAGQRQAIELLRLRELSLREASAISGQSETALKVAAHRAIKRLRTLLEGL
ncbi:MAG: sigma-70 family RNA polymerase sigma factor [Azospirillaceae bacterium]|nr:sigma-70 family RNA polymerase sigma factor [Azospirillaceae bacterium]